MLKRWQDVVITETEMEAKSKEKKHKEQSIDKKKGSTRREEKLNTEHIEANKKWEQRRGRRVVTV